MEGQDDPGPFPQIEFGVDLFLVQDHDLLITQDKGFKYHPIRQDMYLP